MSNITVFSTTWCAFCKSAKAYFDKLGIAYDDKDVERDIAAQSYMVEKTNQMGVPVIQIGEEFVVGFDKARIDKLLHEQGITK
jgi:glutaredoxin 3